MLYNTDYKLTDKIEILLNKLIYMNNIHNKKTKEDIK